LARKGEESKQYSSLHQSFGSPFAIDQDEEVLHSPMTLMPRRNSRNGPGLLNSNNSHVVEMQDPTKALTFRQQVVVVEKEDDEKVTKIVNVDNS
jgi:hypothetical protein